MKNLRDYFLYIWFFLLPVFGFNACQGDLYTDLKNLEAIMNAEELSVPVFSPVAGTYGEMQTVSITNIVAGAAIYYTLDGSEPFCQVSTLYTAPISIDKSVTIQARACMYGWVDSQVATAAYQLQVAAPVFSPAAGFFSSAQTVTLSSSTMSAQIYYTTGTDPTCGSGTLYSAAIGVSANTTIKAIACRSDLPPSSVVQADYTMVYKVGGTVSGLSSTGLVLQNKGGDDLPVTINGSFNFTTPIASGSTYDVTVRTQPQGQTCAVTANSGTVTTGDISSVSVTCTSNPYTVTVSSVSGLVGTDKINLSLNGGSTMSNMGNGGPYTFSSPITYGSSYTVAADTSALPAGGYTGCTVTPSGAQTMGAANANVSVTCISVPYTLSVSVSNLGMVGSISIQNGADTINLVGTGISPLSNNFPTSLYGGDAYSVVITAQPQGQVCALTDLPYGTMPAANHTLNINCVNGYQVSGQVQANPPASIGSFLYQGKKIFVAGSGSAVFADGTAAAAGFNNPLGLVIVGTDLFVADRTNNRIRKIDSVNNVTTFAGSGAAASADGTGVAASFNNPNYLATDGSNLYVTEQSGHCIRRIVISSSVVTTLAGTCGTFGSADGAALSSSFNNPAGLVYHQNALYIADRGNYTIRKLNLQTGQVTTIAGSAGTSGFANGTGNAASFNEPEGLAVVGNFLYISDYQNHRIRRLNLATADVDTLSGSTQGFQDGAAASARFNFPRGLATDGSHLFVADYNNQRLRRINLKTNTVSTIAGDGFSSNGDGIGIMAKFNFPAGLVSDGRRLFVSSWNGHIISQIADNGLVAHYPLTGNANDYASDGAVQNGVWTGAESYANGRYNEANGAASFDGANYVSTKDLYFNHTDSFTISAWVYRTALTAGVIYGKASYESVLQITVDGAVIFINWDAGGQTKFYVSTAVNSIPINQWVHILYTFNKNRHSGNYGGDIYINGRLSTSISGDGKPLDNVVNRAENDRIGHGYNNIYFTGSIADLRVYSRALNDGEIIELAQMADPVLVGVSDNKGATGLLSHYAFDNASGTPSLNDSGPLNYTLTNSDATSANGKDGDIAGAFGFNSNNLSKYTVTGLPLNNEPRTVCAWANPSSLPATGIYFLIVNYGAAVSSNLFGIAMYNNVGTQQVGIYSAGTDNFVNYQTPIHTWTHFCAIHDGANVTLYANGKQILAPTSCSYTTSDTKILIGENIAGGNNFPGKIDDVRIYNNALSADQIRQLAVQVPAGLVARYDFTENNAGDALKDVSGYGNDLTNNSATLTADRFGQVDSVYQFDGTNSYMIRNNPVSQLTANVTMSAWVKMRSYPASIAYILENGANGSNGFALTVNSSGLLNVTCPGVSSMATSFKLPMNIWTHVAGANTGTNNWSVYVNGALQTMVACTPAVPTTAFIIGARSDATCFVMADIDDVRIYNRALTQNEILALSGYHPMQVSSWNPVPGASSLRFHYSADTLNYVDNTTINVLSDISGNNVTLDQTTAANQPTFWTNVINGKPAIRFDGTDDWLQNTSANTVHSNDHAVISVLKIDAMANANNPIFSISDQTHHINDDKKYYITKTSVPISEQGISNAVYNFGVPVLSTGTYNGSASFYADGIIASNTSAVATTANGSNLFLGKGVVPYYKGDISEILYFNNPLTTVSTLYPGGITDREIVECYLSAKYSLPIGHSCP